MKDLTEKQTCILRYIAECIHSIGYPPSIREIGDSFGISSLRGVTVHLEALERKGHIVRGNKARQIVLTPAGQALTNGTGASVPAVAAVPTCHQTAADIISRIRDDARRWNPDGNTAKAMTSLANKLAAEYLELP
jgi:SOS-response transcriptional repressor LexA